MIKLLITTTLIFSLTTTFAQHHNEKYGKPLLVLIESDPWLMVIGSDVPSFALYENGQIIYRKEVAERYKYFQAVYDKDKIQGIFKLLGVTDTLMKESGYYDVSHATDQPTNTILIKSDSIHKIRVYGNLRYNEKVRAGTPAYFRTVYDNMIKFEDSSATEWLPDSIEVLATKFSYSRLKPLKWNAEWSNIKSSTTVHRNTDLYSIYLDKKYFEDFIGLLKKRKRGQAVEINGEKYSLTYRLPFPNIR